MVTFGGMCLTVLTLSWTLCVYCCFLKFHNKSGKLIMNLLMSLILSNLTFIFAGAVVPGTKLCYIIACLDHFFWLVSFMWTAVLAFDISTTFSSVHNNTGEFKFYLISWGFPCLL